MTVHRKFLLIPACCALLALAGCGGERSIFTAETDEPGYREGQALEKQGRTSEALLAYQKVIAKRGDSAPESHLEAGIICFQYVKDPIAAIYHFREYLRLQPHSRQAPLVNGQIQAALRELARSMPLNPLESGTFLKSELGDQVEKLQRENEALKAQLGLRQESAGAVRISRGPTEPELAEPAAPAFVIPRIVLGGGAPKLEEAPAAIAAAPTPPGFDTKLRPAKPAKAGRSYTTVAGDTLWGVMRKTGSAQTAARMKEIIDANRDVLTKGEATPLRPGMELRIP